MPPKSLLARAFLLIVAGAVVGLMPVTSHGAGCGSAFIESSSAHVSDLAGFTGSARADCSDLRSVIRIPAVVLLVLGGVLVVGAMGGDTRHQRVSSEA